MRALFKQIFALGVVLVIGAGLWLALSPNAAPVLARFGLGGASVAAAEQPAGAQKAGGKPPGAQGSPGAAPAGRAGGGRGGRTAVVVVKPASSAVLNDKVQALGTAAALASVSVAPQGSGKLTQVLIQSGATVQVGQVIAKLDNSAEQIALDKAQIAFDDAKQTLDRNAALVKSNSVSAAQVQAVELQSQQAELSLRSAQRDLADREIVAPISGVVGILDVTAGSDVTPQTVIARIEDSSVLRVDFWLPERLSGAVAAGDTVQMVPVSRPQDTYSAQIAALDNQIDAASGTFRVQALVDNAKGTLRPGMALTVSLRMKGDRFVAVDPLSVQWGSDGAYVWRVVDGKADKAMVRIMQRNTEAVLVAGDVAEGDQVISEGLDGLRVGGDVKIFGAPEPDSAPDASKGNGNGKAQGGKPAAPAGN